MEKICGLQVQPSDGQGGMSSRVNSGMIFSAGDDGGGDGHSSGVSGSSTGSGSSTRTGSGATNDVRVVQLPGTAYTAAAAAAAAGVTFTTSGSSSTGSSRAALVAATGKSGSSSGGSSNSRSSSGGSSAAEVDIPDTQRIPKLTLVSDWFNRFKAGKPYDKCKRLEVAYCDPGVSVARRWGIWRYWG